MSTPEELDKSILTQILDGLPALFSGAKTAIRQQDIDRISLFYDVADDEDVFPNNDAKVQKSVAKIKEKSSTFRELCWEQSFTDSYGLLFVASTWPLSGNLSKFTLEEVKSKLAAQSPQITLEQAELRVLENFMQANGPTNPGPAQLPVVELDTEFVSILSLHCMQDLAQSLVALSLLRVDDFLYFFSDSARVTDVGDKVSTAELKRLKLLAQKLYSARFEPGFDALLTELKLTCRPALIGLGIFSRRVFCLKIGDDEFKKARSKEPLWDQYEALARSLATFGTLIKVPGVADDTATQLAMQYGNNLDLSELSFFLSKKVGVETALKVIKNSTPVQVEAFKFFIGQNMSAEDAEARAALIVNLSQLTNVQELAKANIPLTEEAVKLAGCSPTQFETFLQFVKHCPDDISKAANLAKKFPTPQSREGMTFLLDNGVPLDQAAAVVQKYPSKAAIVGADLSELNKAARSSSSTPGTAPADAAPVDTAALKQIVREGKAASKKENDELIKDILARRETYNKLIEERKKALDHLKGVVTQLKDAGAKDIQAMEASLSNELTKQAALDIKELQSGMTQADLAERLQSVIKQAESSGLTLSTEMLQPLKLTDDIARLNEGIMLKLYRFDRDSLTQDYYNQHVGSLVADGEPIFQMDEVIDAISYTIPGDSAVRKTLNGVVSTAAFEATTTMRSSSRLVSVSAGIEASSLLWSVNAQNSTSVSSGSAEKHAKSKSSTSSLAWCSDNLVVPRLVVSIDPYKLRLAHQYVLEIEKIGLAMDPEAEALHFIDAHGVFFVNAQSTVGFTWNSMSTVEFSSDEERSSAVAHSRESLTTATSVGGAGLLKSILISGAVDVNTNNETQNTKSSHKMDKQSTLISNTIVSCRGPVVASANDLQHAAYTKPELWRVLGHKIHSKPSTMVALWDILNHENCKTEPSNPSAFAEGVSALKNAFYTHKLAKVAVTQRAYLRFVRTEPRPDGNYVMVYNNRDHASGACFHFVTAVKSVDTSSALNVTVTCDDGSGELMTFNLSQAMQIPDPSLYVPGAILSIQALVTCDEGTRRLVLRSVNIAQARSGEANATAVSEHFARVTREYRNAWLPLVAAGVHKTRGYSLTESATPIYPVNDIYNVIDILLFDLDNLPLYNIAASGRGGQPGIALSENNMLQVAGNEFGPYLQVIGIVLSAKQGVNDCSITFAVEGEKTITIPYNSVISTAFTPHKGDVVRMVIPILSPLQFARPQDLLTSDELRSVLPKIQQDVTAGTFAVPLMSKSATNQEVYSAAVGAVMAKRTISGLSPVTEVPFDLLTQHVAVTTPEKSLNSATESSKPLLKLGSMAVAGRIFSTLGLVGAQGRALVSIDNANKSIPIAMHPDLSLPESTTPIVLYFTIAEANGRLCLSCVGYDLLPTSPAAVIHKDLKVVIARLSAACGTSTPTFSLGVPLNLLYYRSLSTGLFLDASLNDEQKWVVSARSFDQSRAKNQQWSTIDPLTSVNDANIATCAIQMAHSPHLYISIVDGVPALTKEKAMMTTAAHNILSGLILRPSGNNLALCCGDMSPSSPLTPEFYNAPVVATHVGGAAEQHHRWLAQPVTVKTSLNLRRQLTFAQAQQLPPTFLVVGLSGSGKSTLINALYNYFGGRGQHDLSDMSVAVECSPDGWNRVDPAFAGFTSEDPVKSGGSRTKDCTFYDFPLSRPLHKSFGIVGAVAAPVVTLIDSPGLADTAGEIRDFDNIKLIEHAICDAKRIDGVIYVFNGGTSRFDARQVAALKSVDGLLPQSFRGTRHVVFSNIADHSGIPGDSRSQYQDCFALDTASLESDIATYFSCTLFNLPKLKSSIASWHSSRAALMHITEQLGALAQSSMGQAGKLERLLKAFANKHIITNELLKLRDITIGGAKAKQTFAELIQIAQNCHDDWEKDATKSQQQLDQFCANIDPIATIFNSSPSDSNRQQFVLGCDQWTDNNAVFYNCHQCRQTCSSQDHVSFPHPKDNHPNNDCKSCGCMKKHHSFGNRGERYRNAQSIQSIQTTIKTHNDASKQLSERHTLVINKITELQRQFEARKTEITTYMQKLAGAYHLQEFEFGIEVSPTVIKPQCDCGNTIAVGCKSIVTPKYQRAVMDFFCVNDPFSSVVGRVVPRLGQHDLTTGYYDQKQQTSTLDAINIELNTALDRTKVFPPLHSSLIVPVYPALDMGGIQRGVGNLQHRNPLDKTHSARGYWTSKKDSYKNNGGLDIFNSLDSQKDTMVKTIHRLYDTWKGENHSWSGHTPDGDRPFQVTMFTNNESGMFLLLLSFAPVSFTVVVFYRSDL